ncbi:MAG TPA: ketoacyl-ACP synthase III [Candidatus Paceibacterota bacterium]|nr:ketoacyl-ACP synthase III [Candidatus Paceibacterota bacterium]HPS18427.1 ketoacyl-ACP synthase III [Bacteroidales bacterium]
MIINLVTDYIPDVVIPNKYFFDNYGITNNEIVSKSGINQRRYVSAAENTNSMAIEAVKKAFPELPFSINEIDLIIGATYTPYDTVGTLAHAVQKQFNINKAKCFTVDSACSSFVNAIEITGCYFENKKASKALIIVSENNSIYNDFSDINSGFLWGDGASAIIVTNQRYSNNDIEVIDVNTIGLGNVGKSTDAVFLRPSNGGLKMPFGKDVFQYACTHMIKETEQILQKNNILLNQLSYFIPHQANARITDYISKELKLLPSQVISNIEKLGNTGSASTPIVLSQNWRRFKINDLIVISVFGGGYSSGAILLKKL